MAKIDIKKYIEDLKQTNWRDPGTWALLPKLVVLLAILVTLPALGYFFDTQSQLEDIDRGAARGSSSPPR